MALDRGSVTAEFAVALPAVALVLAACLAGAQLAGLTVRAVDAATAASRQLARGDPAAARALVTRLLPGATLGTEQLDGLACATVTAGASGLLAGVPVRARACALAEG